MRAFNFAPYVNGVDLLAAGAPCQPFSLGGQHKGDEDGRNMFPEVFRAIRATAPKAVLVENVKGLTRENFRPYLEYIELQLAMPFLAPKRREDWQDHKRRLVTAMPRFDEADPAQTYDVTISKINCADYGTPQNRNRVIIVALRRDLNVAFELPKPTHSEDTLLYAKWIDGSYWKEHRARRKRAPEKLTARLAELRKCGKPAEKRWQTVRDALRGLPRALDGIPSLVFPNHIGIPGARVYAGHTGSELDAPSKTVKAGVHGVPGGESIVVFDDSSFRYFTVRETARLQCFPDDFEFVGCRGEAMRQIGNAVPVNVAAMVGRAIRVCLDESSATLENPAQQDREAASA